MIKGRCIQDKESRLQSMNVMLRRRVRLKLSFWNTSDGMFQTQHGGISNKESLTDIEFIELGVFNSVPLLCAWQWGLRGDNSTGGGEATSRGSNNCTRFSMPSARHEPILLLYIFYFLHHFLLLPSSYPLFPFLQYFSKA